VRALSDKPLRHDCVSSFEVTDPSPVFPHPRGHRTNKLKQPGLVNMLLLGSTTPCRFLRFRDLMVEYLTGVGPRQLIEITCNCFGKRDHSGPVVSFPGQQRGVLAARTDGVSEDV
jgi:hypothetical protein